MPDPRAGLYLRLHVEKGKVTVEAAAPVPRWSRATLHAPILTLETYRRIKYPGAETVLSLLDGRGGVLDSFGFSEVPRVFYDHKAPGARGRLTGNTGDPRQTVREVMFPFPKAAKFLNFHRSELKFVRRGNQLEPQFLQQHVVLYSTARRGQPSLPAPALPVPTEQRVRPLRLPWLPPPGERGRQ